MCKLCVTQIFFKLVKYISVKGCFTVCLEVIYEVSLDLKRLYRIFYTLLVLIRALQLKYIISEERNYKDCFEVSH